MCVRTPCQENTQFVYRISELFRPVLKKRRPESKRTTWRSFPCRKFLVMPLCSGHWYIKNIGLIVHMRQMMCSQIGILKCRCRCCFCCSPSVFENDPEYVQRVRRRLRLRSVMALCPVSIASVQLLLPLLRFDVSDDVWVYAVVSLCEKWALVSVLSIASGFAV